MNGLIRGLVSGLLSTPTLFIPNLLERGAGVGLLLPGLLFGVIVLAPEPWTSATPQRGLRALMLVLLSLSSYYAAMVITLSLSDVGRIGAALLAGGIGAALVQVGSRLILLERQDRADTIRATVLGALGGAILIADIAVPDALHAGAGFLIWQGGVANALRPRRPTHHHPSSHD